MWILPGENRIFGTCYLQKWHWSWFSEGWEDQFMADSTKSHRTPKFPWISELLQKVYQSICTEDSRITKTVEEKRSFWMDTWTTKVIWWIEEISYLTTGIANSWFQQEVHLIDAASTNESPRTNSFDMGLSLLSVLINISKNTPQCK